MGRFVLRRLVGVLFISLAIVFFCALGIELMRQSAGGLSRLEPIPALGRALRDTRTYIVSLLRGTLGSVWRGTGRRRVAVPIASVLADTYVKSMGLMLFSLLIAALLGVGAGILAAIWEGSILSTGILTATLLGISLPSFFTALLLQVIEILWYRRTGMRLVPVGGFGWDAHIVLPALVLASRPLAQIARVTCVSMSEAAHQDFVRTAWAKGLSPKQIWGDHVLPNAAVSILTALGLSLRFSLGSLPVVEYYFGWPGLGATLLTAIRGRQFSLLVTLALALGVTFMMVNLVLDLAYRWIDPRLRLES
jgi:peptide/nickel transport system permease protein